MPVQLNLLVQEAEENCITEHFTRECIEIFGLDDESREKKKANMPFRDIQNLAFGFRRLSKIDGLSGLSNLTKLQLDNNNLTKIENLGLLSNLTWLDLSFNKLTKIEGLEALTKLTDLSLYANDIVVIENLETLTKLQVLSIGKNSIVTLDNVVYLRQFNNLQLVNFEGNPLCRDDFYRSYVLAHIKNLVYLDYRRVAPAEIAAAREKHMDVMVEIYLRKEAVKAEAKVAAVKGVHEAAMRAANLECIEQLMDEMTKGDPEWEKQCHIPAMLDGWGDVKEKVAVITQDWVKYVIANADAKRAEHGQWQGAVKKLLDEQDGEARGRVLDFEKCKKHLFRLLKEDPAGASADIFNLKAKLCELHAFLMNQEDETVSFLYDLCLELDTNYGTLVGSNIQLFAEFFDDIRENETSFFASLQAGAAAIVERFHDDVDDDESIPENFKILMQDKDALMASLQASHDHRMTKVDALEDVLIGNERGSAKDLSNNNTAWQRKRNRERLAEVIRFVEDNIKELDGLTGKYAPGDCEVRVFRATGTTPSPVPGDAKGRYD